LVAASAQAEPVRSTLTPFGSDKMDQIELKNDGFVDGGGQAYLQLGFVSGEKAGVWLKVPAAIQYFKVDSFRVLMGSSREASKITPMAFTQIYFHMGLGEERNMTAAIPADVENAAEVTPGPYWNDIPAEGQGAIACARGGQLVGAALEFTHDGAPSIYRDIDGLSNVKYNSIMAIPGGWAYSVAYGLRGDWVLRVLGHEATAAECGM
jgi:hypothetical protein